MKQVFFRLILYLRQLKLYDKDILKVGNFFIDMVVGFQGVVQLGGLVLGSPGLVPLRFRLLFLMLAFLRRASF